jgi:hypothetical protein
VARLGIERRTEREELPAKSALNADKRIACKYQDKLGSVFS